ncbi:hypothetical protein [Arundinibacter roseus]|uniref:Uncharacterized protein n=1 Tax=Arundinibacter roseus TaxID=2070510 RepID=A0A4R4KJ42_9BACT|nr:hypothetical protein [Arundinibacter roseus]TDB66872.1 hypothetical protein EZE20_07030 [Arundinibacter roseus]
MENYELKEFVRNTAMLWKEHKKRELLYMKVMQKDDLGNIRKLCKQGHITALLFQKEIQWIYEYFKCSLNDCDLKDYFMEGIEAGNTLDAVEDKGVLFRILKETEWLTIRSYETVLTFVDKDGEVYAILHDHLDRMNDFYDRFSREISTLSQRKIRPVQAAELVLA